MPDSTGWLATRDQITRPILSRQRSLNFETNRVTPNLTPWQRFLHVSFSQETSKNLRLSIIIRSTCRIILCLRNIYYIIYEKNSLEIVRLSRFLSKIPSKKNLDFKNLKTFYASHSIQYFVKTLSIKIYIYNILNAYNSLCLPVIYNTRRINKKNSFKCNKNSLIWFLSTKKSWRILDFYIFPRNKLYILNTIENTKDKSQSRKASEPAFLHVRFRNAMRIAVFEIDRKILRKCYWLQDKWQRRLFLQLRV